MLGSNSVLQDFLPALLLAGEQVSPIQLYKYKVIVASYHQVSAELGTIQRYYSLLRGARSGSIERSEYPARPSLCLLSGIFGLPEGPCHQNHALPNLQSDIQPPG